jgi:glutamyl endopeptidase
VRRIQVMPGRDGRDMPFGAATSTSFRTIRGWAENGDPNFDYGVIILPTADLGTQVGHLGFAAVPDAQLQGSVVNISGYPGDKEGAEEGTQWFHARQVARVNSRKVFYDIDTFGGQSGSAVYRVVDGNQFQAVAVHAYGVGADLPLNSGTRITEDVFRNLTAWKR